MFIGCCFSLYPTEQAVSECEWCVQIYRSGAECIANRYAKPKAKAP